VDRAKLSDVLMLFSVHVAVTGVAGSLYRHSFVIANKELDHVVLPHTPSK